MEYSDNNADHLLERLVEYAEAFAGSHTATASELTIADLCHDLIGSCDDGNTARFERHYARIVTAMGS